MTTATWWLTLVLVLPLGAVASARGGVPYLLRDLETRRVGSQPEGFVDMGGVAYFRARTEAGVELWRSDGTETGTWMVADIAPGAASSSPANLAVAGSRLYFFADDGRSGLELWTSDGTAAGTRPTADLVPGPAGFASPVAIVDLGGLAYFRALVPRGLIGLYRSDGTATGTRLVVQSEAYGWQEPPSVVGSLLFYTDYDAANGREPWVSDGSAAGTRLLANLRPGSASSIVVTSYVALGGRAYFIANDGLQGAELWSSDGTEVGTIRVADLRPGPDSAFESGSAPIGVLKGQLVFEARDGSGCLLWRYDGIAPAPTPILSLGAGACASVSGYTVGNGFLLFLAQGSFGPYQVWRTDLSPAGTFSLGVATQIPFGGGWSAAASGGSMLFPAFDPQGATLYSTDGSLAQTRSLVSMKPSSELAGLTKVGSLVFFGGTRDGVGRELWRSDGSLSGTFTIAAPSQGRTASSKPDAPRRVRDRLCFAAFADVQLTGDIPAELWCSDGTVSGTERIDLPCVAPGYCFLGFDATQDWLLLNLGNAPDQDFEPWRADGTATGTESLGDLCPGTCSGSPRLVTDAGSSILLAVQTVTNEPSLWATNGTAAGTALVSAIQPEPLYSAGSGAAPGPPGPLPLFPAFEAATGKELWTSDGTTSGTMLVADIRPGPQSSNPRAFTTLGDRVYFSADSASAGRELWSTDGTMAGTRQVADLRPGILGSNPYGLRRFGDSLFFYAFDGLRENFYRSDGTEAGTIALAAVTIDLAMDDLPPPVSSCGLVYFAVSELPGLRLWKTDGTRGGTTRVPGLPVATRLAGTGTGSALEVADGRVWLYADDTLHGCELWQTDGQTSAMVADLNPGPRSSIDTGEFARFRASATHLVFMADDGTTGVEPWALELPTGPAILRNDSVRALSPPAPPLASLLPLEPVRDRYVERLAPGDVDPEQPVLGDATRPLVFYALDGPGLLRLTRTRLSQVRLSF